MGALFINEGLLASLGDVIAGVLDNATARLFTNNYTPTPGDTPGDYTELIGTGYAPVSLTGWTTPALGGDGFYTTQAPVVLWDNSGVVSWTTVYGWFYLDAGGTNVLSAGLFSAPLTIAAGDTLPLLPLIAIGSEYPTPPPEILQMTPIISYPVVGLLPGSYPAGSQNGQAIDARLHPSIMFTVRVNSVGASGTVDFKVQQSVTGAGGWTDVAGSGITTISVPSSVATVELNLASLVAGNFFVRGVITIANNSCTVGLVVQVADGSASDASVVQRLNICM